MDIYFVRFVNINYEQKLILYNKKIIQLGENSIMDFNEQIKQLSKRISTLKNSVVTEEATKTSFIMPFFQILGYDVFNPTEFFPEYVADVGIKKGEKVDYAIIIDGKPCIFVECKSCNEDLDKHASQLFRYFAAAPVKFGILTNGIVYRFYTDLEKDNIMDLEPFVEVNLENINESGIKALMKFRKETFDKSNIYKAAEELKYSTLIKKVFEDEFDTPSDEFVRFVLNDIYTGKKNKNMVEKFKPMVRKAFSAFINDIVNQKLNEVFDTM